MIRSKPVLGNIRVFAFKVLTLVLALTYFGLWSQEPQADLRWYTTQDLQLSGVLKDPEILPFQRLPESYREKVRPVLWGLSENSAGVYIDFETDATEINVQYRVSGPLALPHMPATGVSGLDLYAQDETGSWQWLRGNYQIAEESTYRFTGIKPTNREDLRTYRLYLPLYNSVTYLQIGLPLSARFHQEDPKMEKPVIIYGTSIVQGACASRPGMAWTGILGRQIEQPVVNLGFSGNGRLEPEIIEIMTRQDAAVFVLDCMPNFTAGNGLGPADAEFRILESVRSIRAKFPNTPILLMDHAGYSDGFMQPQREMHYTQLNEALAKARNQIQKLNIPEVYRLTIEEIGLDADCFVDGTHPTDAGMLKYARAVTRKLRAMGID